jgi:NAD(P)H-dependent flavin oxidoreductase YrpB (nitropropane dioxygenase family)
MGVGVSNWVLARAVSSLGQLGVVSGSIVDAVFVRRLQDGDPGGHVRRAMARFPYVQAVEEALTYFRPGGRDPNEPYKALPLHGQTVSAARNRLVALANFVEVDLAREGHDGKVGINLLEKLQAPNPASLYGAMLAGVDFVLMGAGIPKEIPGTLDRLSEHEPVALSFDVKGPRMESGDRMTFDPAVFTDEKPTALKRPAFLPIIASNSLATMMTRKSNGRVDGFVVEGPTAGGHNAPPRGKKVLNERGEPIYGERDVVDLEKLAELGLPFWVAGGAGRPGTIEKVQAVGGQGIQVGSLFAFCNESGLTRELKQDVITRSLLGSVDVRTEDRASPTGFPFKTVQLPCSASNQDVYLERARVCDLGYLRTAYRRDDGRVGYRCPSEPIATYVKKGGTVEDAQGRKCLCNALMSNIGLAQVRDAGRVEVPLLTGGDAVKHLGSFLQGRTSYSAADVIDYLLSRERPEPPDEEPALSDATSMSNA